MSQPAETPTATLLRLVNGYQISQAIHVAAELRLADFIGAEAVSVSDVSARVGAHPESLYRLLRALSTVGVFRETEDRRFVASPVSELLRVDNPQSMWGWPMMIGRPYHWQMWGDLLHSIRTGEDAIHHRYGMDVWAWRGDKPEETTIFNAAMQAMSRNVAPSIIAASTSRDSSGSSSGWGEWGVACGNSRRKPSYLRCGVRSSPCRAGSALRDRGPASRGAVRAPRGATSTRFPRGVTPMSSSRSSWTTPTRSAAPF